MPTIIRNQQFALLRKDDAQVPEGQPNQGHRMFSPIPIDARNEEEAQDLAVLAIRVGRIKPPCTLVKLLCDFADASGPSAVYEGKD